MFEIEVLTTVIPNLYGDRPARVPVNSVLLRYDGHLALIDTGLVGDSSLENVLRTRDITPDEINLVINTHVHPDHTGNNRLFTKARVIASRVDYEFQKSFSHEITPASDPEAVVAKYYPHLGGRHLAQFAPAMAELCRLYWSDDHVGDNVEWTDEEREIMPGLQLVATPGHTFNHFSVLIRGADQQVLIAGDAVPSRLFFRSRLRPAMAHVDPLAQEQSRQRLDTFQGIVIPGHDRPFHSETRRPLEASSLVV